MGAGRTNPETPEPPKKRAPTAEKPEREGKPKKGVRKNEGRTTEPWRKKAPGGPPNPPTTPKPTPIENTSPPLTH